MHVKHVLALIMITVGLHASPAHGAEEMCLNGPYEKNTRLRQSFENSKDDLRQSYLKSLEPAMEPNETAPNEKTSPLHCVTASGTRKQLGYINNLAGWLRRDFNTSSPSLLVTNKVGKDSSPETAAKINPECIAASLLRKPGNEGFTCDYPTPKEGKSGFSATTQSVQRSYGTAAGKTLQCVTKDMVNYLSYAVNSAIQCLSPEDPIDSRVIFKKLNNETAFNPSIAWNGGVGIGQITSIAADEISNKKRGKGNYLLEEVANSQKPECEGFKSVALKDLKARPPIHKQNRCAWVSPGDGLARNLIYSIGYYLVMRDQYIKPALQNRSGELLNNRELISDLTAISYGAEGLEHTLWLLQKHRVNEKTTAEDLQKKIRKGSKYLANIKDKMHEVSCLRKGLDPASPECGPTDQSHDDMEANSCVIP